MSEQPKQVILVMDGPITRFKLYEGYRWWDVARALIELANTLKGWDRQRTLGKAEFVAEKRAFTMSAFGRALAVLVNRCDVCGKTALYRVGTHGWCRAHKDQAAASRSYVQRVRYEPASQHLENVLNDSDRRLRQSQRHHQARKKGR